MHNTWSRWLIGRGIGSQCNHGLGSELVPERSHPVASFITSFFMGEELKYVIQKHEEVMNDDNKKKMLLNILITIGTNWMIYNSENQVTNVAHAIYDS